MRGILILLFMIVASPAVAGIIFLALAVLTVTAIKQPTIFLMFLTVALIFILAVNFSRSGKKVTKVCRKFMTDKLEAIRGGF